MQVVFIRGFPAQRAIHEVAVRHQVGDQLALQHGEPGFVERRGAAERNVGHVHRGILSGHQAEGTLVRVVEGREKEPYGPPLGIGDGDEGVSVAVQPEGQAAVGIGGPAFETGFADFAGGYAGEEELAHLPSRHQGQVGHVVRVLGGDKLGVAFLGELPAGEIPGEAAVDKQIGAVIENVGGVDDRDAQKKNQRFFHSLTSTTR